MFKPHTLTTNRLQPKCREKVINQQKQAEACTVSSSTMKMETVFSLETSGSMGTARSHSPNDRILLDNLIFSLQVYVHSNYVAIHRAKNPEMTGEASFHSHSNIKTV
jgi:hypothetical protein